MPIALFPIFEKQTVRHHTDFPLLSSVFNFSSDHYFAGMWAWDIKDKSQISILNGNIILLLHDYLTLRPFLTLLGNNMMNDTLHSLMDYAQEKHITPFIRLIPEYLLSNTQLSNIEIHEDIDNFDYIFSTQAIVEMKGEKFHQKRKLLNKFEREFSTHTEIFPLHDLSTQVKLLRFFHSWEAAKGPSEETNNEWKALERMIDVARVFPIEVMFLFVNDRLISFSVFEQMTPSFAVSSFQKTDTTYRGSNEKITYEVAKYLLNKGCLYLNVEQDLGVLGLRTAKQAYNPLYLKKYVLSQTQNNRIQKNYLIYQRNSLSQTKSA